ncbi:STAS domain-containing protein [Streptomyces sp. NPDC052013]|uniref:STAS domain-containing protein n=1 Tax=Streptomyces sp. NPDC052013 TaxID=3365679 RepID=UPI0037D38E3A
MTHPPNPRESHDASDRLLLPLPEEIDFGNASEVLDLILCAVRTSAGRPRVLILDLTRTDFMDSQGVRLVGEVSGLLHPGTRVHVVVRPDSVASRVLELTGLRRDVPVYDNVEEAMRAEVPEGLG